MKIIITGASKGIGRGIAEVLAESGHDVGLIARDAAALRELQSQLSAKGVKVAVAAADLRNHDATAAAIAHLIAELGGVDALINNAGVILRKPADEITVDEWQTMMETNINGVFYATRNVLPHLKRQRRGHIVNISSISGCNPLPGGSGYAASKYAVTGFSESLLGEVRQHGIKVTTIFPGSVDTESHQQNFGGTDRTWKIQPRDIGKSVLHALESPDHITVSRIEVRPLRPPTK